jgi:hypothetical protein
MKGTYLFGCESEGHLAWQIRFEKTSDPKTLLFPLYWVRAQGGR